MDLIRFRVSAVIFDKVNNSPIVLLENKDLNRIIPIWIGSCEAVSIAMALNNESYPRPLTHDLFLNTLEELEFKLKNVIIYQVRNDVFYANISIYSLSNEEEIKRIDARPSDAIALAIREKVDILVERGVILESGITLRAPENYEVKKEVEKLLENIKKKKKQKGEEDGKTDNGKN